MNWGSFWIGVLTAWSALFLVVYLQSAWSRRDLERGTVFVDLKGIPHRLDATMACPNWLYRVRERAWLLRHRWWWQERAAYKASGMHWRDWMAHKDALRWAREDS